MVDTVDKGALAPDRNAVSRWEAVLANAARTAGPPMLFGLRLWASVCLALYVAFWLELDNASWAGTSAALVCQPLLGASLRKGWFRMIFTWVRLAQRVPVHIEIDRVPDGVRLVAGMTATVQVDALPCGRRIEQRACRPWHVLRKYKASIAIQKNDP